MTTEKKAGPGKVGATVIGFILAAIGGVFVMSNRDDKPPPEPSPPVVETAPPTETTTPPPIEVLPEPPSSPPNPESNPAWANLDIAIAGTVVVPDSDAKPGMRRRAVIPSGCDADSVERSFRYALEPGYAYLKGDCQIIEAWKKAGGHVVAWLCANGYDSPAAAITRAYSIDRTIRPGDKLAIRLWTRDEYVAEYGGNPPFGETIMFLHRVSNWEPVDGMLLGTLVAIGDDPVHGWMVWTISSYGQHHNYIAEPGRSSLIDHGGYNVIGFFDYHGFDYTQGVDDTEVQFEQWISVPCWKDQPTIRYGIIEEISVP